MTLMIQNSIQYSIITISLFINLLILSLFILYMYISDIYFDKLNKYNEFYNDKRMKELFGTYLFYQFLKIEEETKQIYGTGLVPKITGMLIELDNSELLTLVNNSELIKEKYYEALKVLAEKKKQS
jgi:hypothetical protein